MKRKRKRPFRIYIYLILLVLSVVWISFEGGAFSYLCFFALILQYPLFLLYLIYVNLSLKIHQETPERHLKKNESEDFLLVLENSLFLPIGRLILNYEEQASYLSGEGVKQEIFICPGQRIEKRMKLTCYYAGTYPVGVLSFAVTDPLGLFSASFEVPQKYRAIVSPKITDEASQKMADLLVQAENLFSNTASKDEILGNDLKKYSPGDSYNSIHWKVYARTGELMTRLREDRDVGMYTILLAAERVREEEMGDIIMRDAFLTLAVSVAYYFATQSKPVELVFPRGEWVSLIVDSYEGFEEFYALVTEGLFYPGGEVSYGKKDEDLRLSGRRVIVIYEKDGNRS